MKSRTSDYPLIIIGAGAAGLGASSFASGQGIEHIVLEASHRTGGRGLTELLEGSIPVDLGCHWMHCASINPYVGWADHFGFSYETRSAPYAMHFNGNWLSTQQQQEYETFCTDNDIAIRQAYRDKPESSALETITDQESPWTAYYCYWMSLMHSNDVDQVGIVDVIDFRETGEDWPLKQGYGALIARQGEAAPVRLNNQVLSIAWGSSPVRVTTNHGVLTADRVVVTVSTGVLGASAIEFVPQLPQARVDAIHALPLGNSNYQFFSFDEDTFDHDVPQNIHYHDGEVSMALRVRPFGMPFLFTSTGGRFAWWLEKQGPAASEDFLIEALIRIFGSGIKSGLREFKVSAWGYDPWIRGAYSSTVPGHLNVRQTLAEPLDEKLFFAGEATSLDFLNTAHGAWLSGQRAVGECLACP